LVPGRQGKRLLVLAPLHVCPQPATFGEELPKLGRSGTEALGVGGFLSERGKLGFDFANLRH